MLTWGDNVKSSAINGTTTVTFGGDGVTGWEVMAKSADDNGLTRLGGNGAALASGRLQISEDGNGWENADDGITYSIGTAGAHDLPLWAKQVIDAVEAADAYSITIEFTGEIKL